MIVARDDESHRRLSAAIKAREVSRIYLALVSGSPRSRSGTIDAPLGRDHRAPERRAVGGRGPRDAVTHFEVVETLERFSVLEVRLETGRTHQISVHLAAIGHPVVGDARYGGPTLDRARRASSCTARGLGSRIRSGRASWSSSRSCRRIWKRH